MVVEWLKHHWFILGALVAIGIAWGTATSQINQLENKMAEMSAEQKDLRELKGMAERLDERTLMMQTDQQRQMRLLEDILRSQQFILREQRRVD
jgi:transcription elongation GreA/GreB family factor